MVHYRSDDVYEDIYNFDAINNRRMVEDYSVRPKHHRREEKRAITRLPPVNCGRNLANYPARPSYQASNKTCRNTERSHCNRMNFIQESRRLRNIPRDDQRTTRLPSVARVTSHVTQTQAGYNRGRQNEVKYFEKEYAHLMEGVVDKHVLDRSPQVIEYERKNKLEKRQPDYQKMFAPKAKPDQNNLPPEDIFSRKIHEYEARNQIHKANNSSHGQSLPRVRHNF